MTLQPVSAVNCASLLQPGCSLLSLDGDIFLFGQKGWPKRSCPTGIFMVRLKKGELKLRPVSFSNDSCYLPPLRCPAVAHLDPWGSDPECYLIHGGRTPNNEISGSLYLLNQDSRGNNRKVTLCCQEKELVGEMPGPRFGHTASVVYSRGKRACVLFGGRCYRPPGERTTETWNCVMDCPPQVFLIDLDFGCCSSHIVPELTDGQSFHVALARDDCIYILGGHNLSSDTRPVRLLRIQVQLLLGGPVLSCDIMDNGLSLTSTITVKSGPGHEYVILGGYQSETQKRLECNNVVLDDTGIHIEPRDPPPWTGEITHSRTWFGGSLGKGSALIGVPTEGRSAQPDAHSFYQVSFQMEGDGSGEEAMQGCSQESTDFEDSAPLEDSEELYFGREPHELEDSSDDGDGDTYNEEDEEDESQTGYWMSCCLGCQADPNTWVPYYSTELHRPAMIFCSGGEGGHWVHAQCMDLTETLLVKLSQNSSKYFCLDHGGMSRKEMTPPRTATPLKRVTMKSQHRKAPIRLRMTPTKKSFLRRLFD